MAFNVIPVVSFRISIKFLLPFISRTVRIPSVYQYLDVSSTFTLHLHHYIVLYASMILYVNTSVHCLRVQIEKHNLICYGG